jgi:hypothetical protein
MTPALTVFTSTVYADVARIWHACVARATSGTARIEVFDDSPGQDLPEAAFRGATVLRRSPARRDFHEAYNDALARAATPLLAFVDTDVLCVSGAVWPRAEKELARPEVAAVSFVSRSKTESHGTFAVVMKVEAYRRALASLPGGFFPAIEKLDLALPPERWAWHDTGDLATRAVVAAGYEVRLLNLDHGGFARFDGITLSRRAAEWMGPGALATMSRRSDYFWHGYVGNLALRDLHNRLFPDGPRYAFAFPRARALALTASGGPRAAKERLCYLLRLKAQARAVARFVMSSPTR